MTACPRPELLQSFLAGCLAGAEAEALWAHVEACSSCRALLETFVAGPTATPAQRPPADDVATRNVRFVIDKTAAEVGAGLPGARADWLPTSVAEERLRERDELTATEQPPRLGRYCLEEEIGRGGMGVVYRCRDTELDRPLALKVLLSKHRADDELRQRFLEEARIMGRLQHPGVAPIHELGCLGDGRPFFAMKQIHGSTLAELLADRETRIENRELPTNDPRSSLFDPRLLAIFEQVCQTMAYAHARGIIHRDLKPANIMVGAFGEVQVMDWGLAKVVTAADPEHAPATVTLPPVRVAASWHVRRSAGDLTEAGSALGTPAYMAPEQARGENKDLDARCDVFGLGAILCEVLTGQPPFAGTTSDDSHRRAQEGNLDAAFAGLAACGADAELVTLARQCLAPARDDRPASAAAVAEAVGRYQATVQQRLRQAELAKAEAEGQAREERKRRRVERQKRRAYLALGAVLLLLATLATGVYLWQLHAQELRESGIAAALKQSKEIRDDLQTALQQKGGVFRLLDRPADWKNRIDQAHAALQRARALQDGADGLIDAALASDVQSLEAALDRDLADRDLALKLEKVHQDKAILVKGRLDFTRAVHEYDQIFRESGLVLADGTTADLAQRITQSPIKEQLLAALDLWAVTLAGLPGEKKMVDRLLEVARRADPDPWREQLRNLDVWSNGRELQRLLRELRTDLKGRPLSQRLSPHMCYLVGRLLRTWGTERLAWCREARETYPADFWLNLDLSDCLADQGHMAEATGFARVALAIRPDAIFVHNSLGTMLQNQGDLPGAIRYYQQAIALDPNFALPHANLAMVLRLQGDLNGAVGSYQKALALEPKNVSAHHGLGLVQQQRGDLPGALRFFNQASKLDSSNVLVHYSLGHALTVRGEWDKAIPHYTRCLVLDPKLARAHTNLGICFYYKNDLARAAWHYTTALELDPNQVEAHVCLARALWEQGDPSRALAHYVKAVGLDPKSVPAHVGLGNVLVAAGDLPNANQHFRAALQIEPNHVSAHYNLANVLEKQGDKAGAVRHHREAIRLDPSHAEAHCNLGHVLRDQGQLTEALNYLQQGHQLGSRQAVWRYPSAQWLRDCQQRWQQDPRVQAILQGKARAQDADEWLSFAVVCQQLTKQPAAAVRFYTEAFAAEPKLAVPPHRYRAARAALLAAAGAGTDAGMLTTEERTRLRRQALAWLTAELATLRPPAVPAATHALLEQWHTEPDLASVRGVLALATLPAQEREQWQQFWAEAGDLLNKARNSK